MLFRSMKYSLLTTSLLIGAIVAFSGPASAQGEVDGVQVPEVGGVDEAVIFEAPDPGQVVQDHTVTLESPGHIQLPGGGRVDSAISIDPSDPGYVQLPGGGEVDKSQIVGNTHGKPEGVPPQDPPMDVPGRQ